LYRATAARWWPSINLYLVTWGQNVCRPVYPRCGACVIGRFCPRIGVTSMGRG
jgi:endonuclease III